MTLSIRKKSMFSNRMLLEKFAVGCIYLPPSLSVSWQLVNWASCCVNKTILRFTRQIIKEKDLRIPTILVQSSNTVPALL